MQSAWDGVSALAKEMGVTLTYKNESKAMRLLGRALFFNKAFMTRFTTTIGSTVFFPSREAVLDDPNTYAVVLAHELTHVQDSRDLGFAAFSATYLLPQLLSLGSLVALLTPWLGWPCLLSLASLLYLRPSDGAPGRANIEYRGYATSLACITWGGAPMADPPEWVASNFWGPNYFWMDPDRSHVEGRLRGWIFQIGTGAILESIPITARLKPIFEKAKPFA